MTSASTMRKIGKKVKSMLPNGWGYMVIVFPESRPGISNYVSSGQRADCIIALRECADRLEAKMDFHTPEDN
jgi:hypothetical protein